MSAIPKSLTLGLIFCGAIGGAVMSNLYSKVSNYRIAYLRCNNLLEKAKNINLKALVLNTAWPVEKLFIA